MKLNEGEFIHIGFDRISENSFNRLRYRIIHCDADWKISRDISEIDYLDGFNDNLIEDYATSINTTVDYTHFNLDIPNRDVSLKLSGNYVVQVYEENDPDNILLNACFSVIESKLNVAVTVSSNTDIDTNKSHQQVSFSLIHPGMNIRDPFNDLKIFVRQNDRLDNERRVAKPSQVAANKLTYDHIRNLIFEAGNEYRRFETSSYRYNGMNVGHIEYNRPNYSMYIEPDRMRLSGYRYDQDQNGKFIIRSADVTNFDTEADYFITHFSIPMDEPLLESVYINGNFTDNSFTDKYKLEYDHLFKGYHVPLLLKQGLYNYQYLTKTANGYSTSAIEGNYFEAENEYSVLVYYRPAGQRYDSLIGYTNLQSRKK